MAWKYWPGVDCNGCPLPKEIKKISHSTGPQWPGGSTLALQGRRESTQPTKRRKDFSLFPLSTGRISWNKWKTSTMQHTRKRTRRNVLLVHVRTFEKNDIQTHEKLLQLLPLFRRYMISVSLSIHCRLELENWTRWAPPEGQPSQFFTREIIKSPLICILGGRLKLLEERVDPGLERYGTNKKWVDPQNQLVTAVSPRYNSLSFGRNRLLSASHSLPGE